MTRSPTRQEWRGKSWRRGAEGRDHLGVQHRVASGRVLERRVRVPERVAQAVGAASVVRLQDLPVGAEVGDVAERLVTEPVLLDGGRAELRVQGAVEPLAERELLVVGHRLVVEPTNGEL